MTYSAYFFKFSNYFIFKETPCPLQLLSYALEINLSIVEFQGPEFFYYAYISIACTLLMLLPGNFYNIGPFSLPRPHIHLSTHYDAKLSLWI